MCIRDSYYRFAVKSGTFYQLTTSDLSPGIDTVLKVYNLSLIHI